MTKFNEKGEVPGEVLDDENFNTNNTELLSIRLCPEHVLSMAKNRAKTINSGHKVEKVRIAIDQARCVICAEEKKNQ